MELNDRQSAEPGQCGSCQHYRPRDPGDGFGECRFNLPPWIMSYFQTTVDPKEGWEVDPKEGWEVDPRTVQDTDTCSFYEIKKVCGSPAQFIQKRYWQAGNPSR